MHVTKLKISFLSKGHSTKGPKIPFISNLKKSACASKRELLELATIWLSIDNSQPDTLLIPKMKLQLLVLWLHTEGTTSYAVGSLGVVNNFELAIFLACC